MCPTSSATPGPPLLLVWKTAVAFTLVPLLRRSPQTIRPPPDSKRDLSHPKSDHISPAHNHTIKASILTMAHKDRDPFGLASHSSPPATRASSLAPHKHQARSYPQGLCPACVIPGARRQAVLACLAEPPHQDSTAGPHRPAAAIQGSQSPPSRHTAHHGLCSAGAATGIPRSRSLSRGPTQTTGTTVGTCREEHTCPTLA